MSFRSVLVLALVAVVTVQANSFPYSAKGGQSFYQEPLQGQYVQGQQFRQPLATESFKSAPVVQSHQQVETAAVAAPLPAQQTYEAPVKGAQSFYQEPLQGQFVQQPLRQPAVQATVEPQRFEAAPVQAQTYEAPAKGQSFYQDSSRGQFAQPLRQPAVFESYKSMPQFTQQPAHQQVESVATVAAPVQTYEAPAKGQNFYQESFRGQFAQPLRQPAVAESYKSLPQFTQQPAHQQVESVATVAAPVQAQTYEAPVKGTQSWSYQEPLKSAQQPFRQQFAQPQHAEYVSAPSFAPARPVQSHEGSFKGSSQLFFGQPTTQQVRQPSKF